MISQLSKELKLMVNLLSPFLKPNVEAVEEFTDNQVVCLSTIWNGIVRAVSSQIVLLVKDLNYCIQALRRYYHGFN